MIIDDIQVSFLVSIYLNLHELLLPLILDQNDLDSFKMIKYQENSGEKRERFVYMVKINILKIKEIIFKIYKRCKQLVLNI